MPDPQELSTFTSSFLDWEKVETPASARMLDWYRTLIALRRSEPDLMDPDLSRISVEILEHDGIVLRRGQVAALVSDADHEVRANVPHTEVLAAFGSPADEERIAAGTDGEELALSGPGVIVVRGRA